MSIINSLVAYILYFISPKTLMKRSFIGTLLRFNIKLPNEATDEILDYLYDIYMKNKQIDRVLNRGEMNTNMERMWDLIQYEAFFIRDLLVSPHVAAVGHEEITNILNKYNKLIG